MKGNVPFWCEDVTPRQRRVPVTDASTTHPSGVLGMAGLQVDVKKKHLERLSSATAAIVDSSQGSGSGYETGAPKTVNKLNKPSIRLREASSDASKDLHLTLVLQTAEHGSRKPVQEQIGDSGLVSIAFE